MKNIIVYPYSTTTEIKIEELVDDLVRRPEKKFKCDVCSKFFSSKHCLKEHGYTHTNERPYSCPSCQKPFKHASQLSLHKKVHLVKHELVWPKLTEMLARFKPDDQEQGIPQQVVSLPFIQGPQTMVLPKFNY
jgi:hypothetical protein